MVVNPWRCRVPHPMTARVQFCPAGCSSCFCGFQASRLFMLTPTFPQGSPSLTQLLSHVPDDITKHEDLSSDPQNPREAGCSSVCNPSTPKEGGTEESSEAAGPASPLRLLCCCGSGLLSLLPMSVKER